MLHQHHQHRHHHHYRVRLPAGERRLVYAVWALHALLAFWVAYRAGQGSVSEWLAKFVHRSWTGFQRDNGDAEFLYFRATVWRMLVVLTAHSVTFWLALRFLPNTSTRQIALAVFWLLLHLVFVSWQCVAIILALTAVTAISVRVSGNSIIPPWLISVAFIARAPVYAPFSKMNYFVYQEYNIYQYSAVKSLNFALWAARNPDSAFTRKSMIRLAQYLFYPPYTMSLIVLYEKFVDEMEHRENGTNSQRTFRTLSIRAVRLAVASLLFEFLIHLLRVHALFNAPYTMISHLNPYELAAISYVVGALFHLKYVPIFGVPAWFAAVDGLDPPGGPICISRVSRYSRMWRLFDVGLYRFLKDRVYVPLLQSTEGNSLRRFVAMVAVFLVVLVWHGTDSRYIFWVALSAFELCVERLGAFLWKLDAVQNLRAKIGELAMRRLVALGMLCYVVPGIFGTFFFLAEEGTGAQVFRKVFVDGTLGILTLDVSIRDGAPTAGFVMLHLFVLGYFFNHVCEDLDEEESDARKARPKSD